MAILRWQWLFAAKERCQIGSTGVYETKSDMFLSFAWIYKAAQSYHDLSFQHILISLMEIRMCNTIAVQKLCCQLQASLLALCWERIIKIQKT